MKSVLFICIILCSSFISVCAQTTYKADYVRQVKQCSHCNKNISTDVPVKISMITNGTKTADMSSKVLALESGKLIGQYMTTDEACINNGPHSFVAVKANTTEDNSFSNTFTYDNADLIKPVVNEKAQAYRAGHKSIVKDCDALVNKAYRLGLASSKANQ